MHTPNCLAVQNRLSHQNHVFMLAYPHHCPECDGLGVHISRYDPSASGVSLAYGGCFLEIEPCPSCLGKDRCPKCGESVDWLEYSDWLQEDHYLCRSCGWRDNDYSQSRFFSEYECDCWEIGVNGL